MTALIRGLWDAVWSVFNTPEIPNPYAREISELEKSLGNYWRSAVVENRCLFRREGQLSNIKKTYLHLQNRISLHPHPEAIQTINRLAHDILFLDQCCDRTVPTVGAYAANRIQEESKLREQPNMFHVLAPVLAFYDIDGRIPPHFQHQNLHLAMPLYNPLLFDHYLKAEGIVGSPSSIAEELCTLPNDGSFTFETIAPEIEAITTALNINDNVFARYAAHHIVKGERITEKNPITHPELLYSCLYTEIILALTGTRTGIATSLGSLIKTDPAVRARVREYKTQFQIVQERAPHFKKFLDHMIKVVISHDLFSAFVPDNQEEDAQ